MGRTACIAAALAVAVAACAVEPAPPSPGPSRSVGIATPTVAVATSPSPADAATATPIPASTEPPGDDGPARPDPATFLQVCRSDALAAVAPAPCSDVVAAALGAPELAGARIERVALGGMCDPPRSCGRAAVRPSAWVTVLSDRDPLILEVLLAADGGLSVAGAHPAIPPPVPSFAPPAPGRAELPGAPASLTGRPAYPLCGTERAPMGGPYDEAARTCFLTGVLAGSPVELASMGAGTEGAPFVSLYRYAGTGGIEVVTGEGAAWTRRFTGVADAGGGLVFDVGGLSTAPEPVP